MPINQTGPNAQANIGTYNDVAGNFIVNHMIDVTNLERKQLLINTPRAQAGLKDYQTSKKIGPCFEGTRVALLEEMADWVASEGKSRIYVLSGLAGIGKSTVAYSIAAWADDLDLLGASFFFSRDDVDRSNAKKFFTTLAFQLCLCNVSFAKAIGSALATERGSEATTAIPEKQLDALVLEPLRDIAALSIQPILIVVDALDECDVEDAPSVLEGLCRMVQSLPTFKVILTTRPQPLVNNDFATLGGHTIFHLQDIEDKVIEDDIRLYLKHRLSREQVKVQLQDPTEQWYASNAEIETLVHAVGKLFIIASTAVLFILDKDASDPEGQIAVLLDTFAQDRTPLKGLDNFYSVILRNAVPEDCDNHIAERYQSVIGTIMVLQIPLSITILAQFINRRVGEIKGALRKLQSVILVGDDDVPRLYHKSFLDYVTDPARCKDVDLLIDPRDRHTWIVTRCFELMNGGLKYNILRLGGPARFMDNKGGRAHQGISDEILQKRIPPGLRYACAYWAKHLESSKPEDTRFMEQLGKFADDHMLHWFEALSLIEGLDMAHRSIRVALRLVRPTPSDLFYLLSDGLRFISRFYQLIRKSALHTYYSALPFTPTKSLLYRRYQREAVNGICGVTGGLEQWNALITTQEHGWISRLNKIHVRCSHDSTMFASWEHDGEVKFWDATTGTPISALSFSGRIAITNDFSIFASAKDNDITLYSMKGSKPLATFKASTRIEKLAFSSESRRVATWLLDKTICLWDTGNGELIASFGQSDCDCTLLRFSPTGTRLVFVPENGEIQLRDGVTGELVTNIHDPSNWRHELVFSNDGSRFAVLAERAVRLWESESGELEGVAVNGINSISISANGSLLATYNNHGKLQVWSVNSGNPLTLIEEQDVNSVLSMEFSAEDMLAVGIKGRITLYDVRKHSAISMLSIDAPISLTFSPDCTRLAAINWKNDECALHLWDVQSIKASRPLSTEEAVRVHSLAFSQGDARLAFQLESDAVVLFEMATGRMILRKERVVSFGFSPDGRKSAAGFVDRTVQLLGSEDGASIGSVGCSSVVKAVALSDRMLAVASWKDIALWDIRTLNLVGTIKRPDNAWLYDMSNCLLFSNNGDLLVLYERGDSGGVGSSTVTTVTVLDVMKHRLITTFRLQNIVYEMAFLPDNSQLVVQFSDGSFQSLNIVSREVTCGPTFNHLCSIPHWHGIPVWFLQQGDNWSQPPSLLGSFSEHKDPVPVLWVPEDVRVMAWAQGSSTLALACKDGNVIFIRSSNDHSSAKFTNFSLTSLVH